MSNRLRTTVSRDSTYNADDHLGASERANTSRDTTSSDLFSQRRYCPYAGSEDAENRAEISGLFALNLQNKILLDSL